MIELPDALPKVSVAVVGNINFDWYEEGEQYLGGAGPNVATGLARLGLVPCLIGAIGGDDKLVEDILAERGITPLLQRVQGVKTGRIEVGIVRDKDGSVIDRLFGRSGGLAEEVAPGANIRLGEGLNSLEERHSRAIDSASLLYVSAYALVVSPQAAYVLRLMERANEKKIPVLIDLAANTVINAPVEHLNTAMSLDSVKVVKMNEGEFGMIVGPGTLERPFDARIDLLRETLPHVEYFIITLGPAGAKIAGRTFKTEIDPISPPNPVADVAGAGDAFSAGFIATHLAGLDLNTCGRAGVAVAERAIAMKGGAEYQVSWKEIRSVLQNG